MSPRLEIDQRDADAVRRALRAGWRIIPCTGRPYPSARPWVERLGLRGPFVCYQGAQVRQLDGSTLWDRGLRHHLAMEVVLFCREHGYHVHAYRDDRLLVERDRPEAHVYANHAQMKINVVPDLDTALGATTPKVVIVADSDRISQLLPEVRQRWTGRLNAATSEPIYLEMTAADADKGRALEFICERMEIPSSQVVAVGDGRNDGPMLEWAGLAVAVEGAAEELMAVADRVVSPPGSGGLAQLIDELLG